MEVAESKVKKKLEKRKVLSEKKEQRERKKREGRKEGRNGWNEKENLIELSIFHVLILIMNVIDFFF